MSATTVPCCHSMSAASFGISSAAEAFAWSASTRNAAATQFNADTNHFVLLIFRLMENSHFRFREDRALAERSSVFADVFVPQCRILRDKFAQHLHTFFRRKINHFDSVFLKPVDPAAKIHGFTDNHHSNSELADQSAAIPARRERRHHDLVAIAFLAPRSAKCIGLSMRRRIALLHPAVVPSAQKFPGVIEKSRADRNPALRKPVLRFFHRRLEQTQVIHTLHLGLLAALPAPISRRDGVVELHKNDEADAPIRVEDAEQCTERIKRLCNQDAPANRGGNFRRSIALNECSMRRAAPAEIQKRAKKQYVGPIGDQSRAVRDEFRQEPRRERHESNQKKKRQVNPGEVALGALEVVELRLLAHPKNAKSQKAHQINQELWREVGKRGTQIAFAANQLLRGHMKFQQKQSHGHAKDTIAQRREAFHALAGNGVVRGLHIWIRSAYFRDASTFLPYSRALAKISGSFSVRSFLSLMTMRPPITTVSTSPDFKAYASCA